MHYCLFHLCGTTYFTALIFEIMNIRLTYHKYNDSFMNNFKLLISIFNTENYLFIKDINIIMKKNIFQKIIKK